MLSPAAVRRVRAREYVGTASEGVVEIVLTLAVSRSTVIHALLVISVSTVEYSETIGPIVGCTPAVSQFTGSSTSGLYLTGTLHTISNAEHMFGNPRCQIGRHAGAMTPLYSTSVVALRQT